MTPPALRHLHRMMNAYADACLGKGFGLFTLNEAWNCRKATDVQCMISVIEYFISLSQWYLISGVVNS